MRNFAAAKNTTSPAARKSAGRKKRWREDMQARFAEGTFAAIDRVRADGESRTDFVREAVAREIARRKGR